MKPDPVTVAGILLWPLAIGAVAAASYLYFAATPAEHPKPDGKPPATAEPTPSATAGPKAAGTSASADGVRGRTPAGRSWAVECGKGQHIDITDSYLLRHYPPNPPGNSPLELYKTGRLANSSPDTLVFRTNNGEEEHFRVADGMLFPAAIRAQGVAIGNRTSPPVPLKDCGPPVTVDRKQLTESTPVNLDQALILAVSFGDAGATRELLRKGADPRSRIGTLTLPAMARSAKLSPDDRAAVLAALAAYGVEEKPRSLIPPEWRNVTPSNIVPSTMHGKWSAMCELSNQWDSHIEVGPTRFFNAPVESVRANGDRFLIITRSPNDMRGAIARQVRTNGVRIAVTSEISEYRIEGIEPKISPSDPLVIARCR